MKKLLFIALSIVPFCLFSQVSLERQVIASGGGFQQSGNIQLSSTIGEAVIVTATSGSIILTQGFQQTQTEIVGIEIPEFNVDVLAYPNPTGHSVTLEISALNSMDIYVEVMDVLGRRVIPIDKITVQNKATEEYDFSKLAAGNYLISLKSSNKRLLTTIKIQKIN